MGVRRESVVLDVESNIAATMMKDAQATALLKRELSSLDGSTSKSTRSTNDAEKAFTKAGNSAERSSKQIDKYSGRLGLLAEVAIGLGPALVPIGAVGIPAVTGLAAGFGAAATAAGVAVLAMQGVGDALKAMDAAQLEPTKANLEKMHDALDNLGPAGAQFVRFLDGLEPQLHALQDTARAGLFPGVEDGIKSLLTMFPQVRRVVFDVATELGHLSAEAGKGLSGDGFAGFFRYIETDAAPMLSAFAHTIGNVVEGFANLLVAFAPLSRDFASGMEHMSQSFADWAAGLSKTDSFRSFVEYVRESGPQVLDLLGALADAFVGIIKAAAPVGQAVLPVLTALAHVLGTIADSPIGPPLYTGVAAMLALNRAATITTATMTRFGASAETAALGAGKVSGALQAVGLALGGAAVVDSMQKQFDGLSTSVGSLSNQLIALSNAGAGAKLSGEFSDLADQFDRLAEPNKFQAGQDWLYKKMPFLGSDSRFDEATAKIKELDAALTNLATHGSTEEAQQAFAALARSMGLNADEQAKLLSMLPQYKAALSTSADAADASAAAQGRNGDAAAKSRAQIRGLVAAMQAQRQASLAAFDAETQWRQALKDATAQAAKNSAGIKGNSKAALDNRSSLSQLAGAWNNQSAAVKNNVSRYAEARSAFLKTAHDMGVPTAAAEKLANRLLEIPKSVVTHVDALTGTALQALAEARRELAKLDGSSATMYLHTVRTGPGGQGAGYSGYAAGGPVKALGGPSAGLPGALLERTAA